MTKYFHIHHTITNYPDLEDNPIFVSQWLNDKCKEWDLSWVYVSPVGGDDGGGGDGGGGGGGGGGVR